MNLQKDLIHNSDVLIIGNHDEEFKELVIIEIREEQVVIDLIRLSDEINLINGKYYGICR